MSELQELRRQIDELDEKLFKTLGRRMEIVEALGRYKKAHGRTLRDDERFQAMLSTRLARAESLGLPDDLVTELYELIHKFALEREAKA